MFRKSALVCRSVHDQQMSRQFGTVIKFKLQQNEIATPALFL
jgi:hypothetical protein